MKQLDVIGFGAMNLDLMYRVERLVADGESRVIEHDRFGGGSAANTVYGLARLGLNTGFIGAVGDDEAGSFLLDDFRSAGVDTSQIAVKPDVQTGSVLAITSKAGREMYVFPGANGTLQPQDIDLDYVNHARILHLSSFVVGEQMELQKKVLASLAPSVKVSFAPGALYASKGLKQMTPFLRRTHLLFINKAEIEEMTGLQMRHTADLCLGLGCRIVAVTLGKGVTRQDKRYVCYVATPEGECWIEGATVRKDSIVDTTGAGDAFAAGFLYGFLKGKDVQECGRLGDIVAGFSLGRLGARAGLPTRAQVERAYGERRAGRR